MPEAVYVKRGDVLPLTRTAAQLSGQVVQDADGRAMVAVRDIAAAANGEGHRVGVFDLLKTASVVILAGGEVWWDASANTATIETDGDFYVGIATQDAASGDSTVRVDLNVAQVNQISLARGRWTDEATLGLGVVNQSVAGIELTAAFDAVAEAAQAALFSVENVDVDDGPILECMFAIFDIGDNVVLDINIGLAVGSHATDFEAIAEFVAIQLDGNALDINAHSDDGTTDVALVDTTVNAVDNTWIHLVIDCRDKTSCKIYLDGIRVLSGTTFVLTAFSGNLVPIMHIEKSGADNTLADVRVRKMNVRKQAA